MKNGKSLRRRATEIRRKLSKTHAWLCEEENLLSELGDAGATLAKHISDLHVYMCDAIAACEETSSTTSRPSGI